MRTRGLTWKSALLSGALFACGDPTTTSSLGASGGAGGGVSTSSTGGAPACEPRTVYGAGQLARLATYGENVYYVRPAPDESHPASLVRSDLDTGEDFVLLERPRIGPFTVFGDAIYVVLSNEIRRLRFDGASQSRVTKIDPATNVSQLFADATAITWLDSHYVVHRRENGSDHELFETVSYLVGSPTDGVFAALNDLRIGRVDANGITPVAVDYVGHPLLVHDGFAIANAFDGLAFVYHRIDLETGAMMQLFSASYVIHEIGASVADGDRFYAVAYGGSDQSIGGQLLMGNFSGGEPKVLATVTPNRSFDSVAVTDKRVVWTVFDSENTTSQIRSLCKDSIEP